MYALYVLYGRCAFITCTEVRYVCLARMVCMYVTYPCMLCLYVCCVWCLGLYGMTVRYVMCVACVHVMRFM